MCEICGKSPCHPRCPNAREPEPVYFCDNCGGEILPGHRFLKIGDFAICEECIPNLTPSDWAGYVGGSWEYAE